MVRVPGISKALQIGIADSCRSLRTERRRSKARMLPCSEGLMMAAVPQRKPRECQDVTRNSLLRGEGLKGG